MADVAVKVVGDKELDRAIRRMRAVSGQRAVQLKALKQGGAPIADAAALHAPRGEGSFGEHLADTFKVQERRDEKVNPTVSIGPTKFTGLFMEMGWRYGGARPFLRPAFDAHSDEAYKIYADEMWAILRRAASK